MAGFTLDTHKNKNKNKAKRRNLAMMMKKKWKLLDIIFFPSFSPLSSVRDAIPSSLFIVSCFKS